MATIAVRIRELPATYNTVPVKTMSASDYVVYAVDVEFSETE